MAPYKLYYLAAEVAPFSETYELASFSRKITSRLNLKSDLDLRVSQPKYGFVSERKYILREVIRLKDIPVKYNNKTHIINIKSSFIPETRVQVYFMENNSLYKELPELIYKARNGRVYNDIDARFSFFNKAVLDTLQSLFWMPDVIICNDWQMSFIPTLLKEQFIQQDFYSKVKTIYMIHSINNYRKFSKSTYNMLNIDTTQSGNQFDNHIQAMEHADLTIAINYESSKLMNNLKKQKKLFNKFESSNHLVIEVPIKTNSDVWEEISNTIESAARAL